MEKVNSDLIRGNIDTIVLRCLHRGDMYGLEICNLIKEASGGTYVIKQPTLYSALRRLAQRKKITSYWQDSKLGGRRHYYKLTELGRQSFLDKKEDWSDAKEIVDTLVEGIARKRRVTSDEPEQGIEPGTVLTLDAPEEDLGNQHSRDSQELLADSREQKLQEVELASFFIANNSAYDPFEESEDFLTLQLRERTRQQQVVAQQIIQDESNEYISYNPKPAVQESMFAKYLSPGDHAVFSANKAIATSTKTAKVAQYDVELQPFIKHYNPYNNNRSSKFLFINRLRLASSLVLGVFLAILILIAQLSINNIYSAGEEFFFTAAFAIIATYLVVYFAFYVTASDAKRVVNVSVRELVVRLVVAAIVTIAIVCINILAGLNFVNVADFLVFVIVPVILTQAIYLEWVVQMLFKRSRVFAEKY